MVQFAEVFSDQQIVSACGRQLESEFGRAFSAKCFRYMIRFVELFPNLQIVQSLITQLGSTHFLHSIFNRSTYFSFLELNPSITFRKSV